MRPTYIAHPASSTPDFHQRLELLAGTLREDLADLADLHQTALQTMLRIGQALVEAKRICVNERSGWHAFLQQVGIGERRAREAIVFYNRRDEIQSMMIQGTPVLTVTAVRRAFAASRSPQSQSDTGKHALPLSATSAITTTTDPSQRIRASAPDPPGDASFTERLTVPDSTEFQDWKAIPDQSIGSDRPSRDRPDAKTHGIMNSDEGFSDVFAAHARFLEGLTASVAAGAVTDSIPHIIQGMDLLEDHLARLQEAIDRVR